MKFTLTFLSGLFFILIGLEILLKLFFHISLPLFRILFALLFIYLGVCMLTGRRVFWGTHAGCCGNKSEVFGSYNENYKDKETSGGRVSIVFGEKNLDLTGLKIKGEKASFKLDCVFGDIKVTLDKGIPVRITGNSAFGLVELPGSNKVAFGENKYESPGFTAGKPYIEINASAVFGHISFN